MRHRLSHLAFLAVLLALLPGLARAQFFSVYGTFSPVHASHIQTGSTYSASAGYTPQYTSYWAPAFGGGVTLNFLNLHLVKLGLDARGSTKPGTTGADTAELSLRLGFDPPVLRLKPFVQAGVGYLATRTTNVTTSTTTGAPVAGTFNNQYATVGFHAGVDHPIFPFIDFRVIDVGYAHALDTGLSFSNNDTSANIFSLSTGIVAHF